MATDREMIQGIRRLCESALDASLAAGADDLAALRLGVRAAQLSSRLDFGLPYNVRLHSAERFAVNLASPISAYMLAPEFELALTSCLMRPQGDDVEALATMLQQSFGKNLSTRSHEGQPVVVSAPSMRDFVEQMLVEVNSQTVVVTYDELPEGAEVEQIGTLGEGAKMPTGLKVVERADGDWTWQSVELEDSPLSIKAERALRRAVDHGVASGAGDVAGLELGIEAAMTWLDSIRSASYGDAQSLSTSFGGYEAWQPGGPLSPGASEPNAWNAATMLVGSPKMAARRVSFHERELLPDAGPEDSDTELDLTASEDQGWLMEPTDDSNWDFFVPTEEHHVSSWSAAEIAESLTATEDQGWLVPPESTT